MKTGIIKFFDTTKGYGFITADSGKDYFFHITYLNEDLKSLENIEGLEVTFDTMTTYRSVNATNISIQHS